MTRQEWEQKNKGKMNEAVAMVVDSLARGDLPKWAIANAYSLPEGVDIPSLHYSFLNRILVAIQGGFDVRGFKTWNNAGRKIKKGSRAVYIWGPVMKKKPIEKENPETGETETVVINIPVAFKPIPVFRAEDTEGEPLGYDMPEVPEIPLVEVARDMGLNVTAGFQIRTEGGYYNGSEIHICTPDATTFYHELGHHCHKLVLKEQGKKMQGGQDQEQEIIAELVGACLSNMMGQAWDPGQIAAYVNAYKGDPKRVFKLFPVVEKCIQKVFDAAEETGFETAVNQ